MICISFLRSPRHGEKLAEKLGINVAVYIVCGCEGAEVQIMQDIKLTKEQKQIIKDFLIEHKYLDDNVDYNEEVISRAL